MMEKVITIDGPAGAGKSTVSKAVAAKLQYIYLDTGALYRALAYKALKNNINVRDANELAKLCSTTDIVLKNLDGKLTVYVDGENIDNKIRTEEVGLGASTISAFPVVREKLLSLQREAGARGGIVAEGRDMGSVVFPEAEFKFFLDADVEERIQRRHAELVQKNGPAKRDAITRDMQARDQQDSQRKIAPLTAASDAIIIDSTFLDVSQVVEIILKRVSGGHDRR
ncbi:MAG: (d)CMP kinase [Candidatus Moduliflexus flocculans]|nr:(d)CMP kinase [Candidatus Moduliflexus flocculans]